MLNERKQVRPELLSPSGSWDSLTAAVTNGSDAVYLGTREFNARINAKNFSLEELARVVEYCHTRGVKVYLTLNTLVKNSEIARFFSVLSRAYMLGIDGIIIQHISFLETIKKNFPGLKVFISTQGAIGNASSASLLKSADRIILPRELSLEEIRKISASGIIVETFVHGALCFGYSGLCLFSSFVANRSGNRGACAQLCRQKYNNTYLLSTRELNLVRRIPELIQAGVHSFKIEGRMRSPLYVAVSARLYRKAIDSYFAGKFAVPQKEMAEIEVVFNREFTEGLAFGEKDLVSPERPMNRGAFLGVVRNDEIELKHPVAAGDGVGIWSKDNITGAVIREITANGRTVQSAATGDRVNLGIGAKNGSRIYLTSSVQISLEPDFTIKRSPIVLPERQKTRLKMPAVTPRNSSGLKFMVKAYSLQEAREISRAGADIVFYNIFSPDFPAEVEWLEKATLGAYLPRIMNDDELSKALDIMRDKIPGAVLAGNLGFLAWRRDFNIPVYLDYNLNAFNDLDLLFFQKYNTVPVLSPELSLTEMMDFKNKDAVIYCHGDIVLVNSKIEIKDNNLADEKGLVFPVRKEGSYWQILNSRPYGLFNDVRKIHEAGFNHFFIDYRGKGARFVAIYRSMLRQEVADRKLRKGSTSGHLYRPVG